MCKRLKRVVFLVFALGIWVPMTMRAQSSAAHYRYRIINSGGKLWCRYCYENKTIFEFCVGAAGTINQLNWCGSKPVSLLSPTFAGEHTDRVIQTTWWLNSLHFNLPRQTEQRWNVTQAGNGNGEFSVVNAVIIDRRHNRIDVYSYPRKQWNKGFDSTFNGGYKILTRYQGLAHGVISIRRVMIATQPDSLHNLKPYKNLYVEAWTPFNQSDSTFNALALSFDPSGIPKRFYNAHQNIPMYPAFPVQQTDGYAVVYNNKQIKTGIFAALVFGKHQLPDKANSYVLNTMNWKNGIGVLPGITLNNFPVNGIIDQQFYLYASKGINANMAKRLDDLSARLPQLKLYKPNDHLPFGLQAILRKLGSYSSHKGETTELLGNIAGYGH